MFWTLANLSEFETWKQHSEPACDIIYPAFLPAKQVRKNRPFWHKLAFQKSRGPMILFSYQVIKFRLGLFFQNDKIKIHN